MRQHLTGAERRLWDAFPTGSPVDLRTGDPDKDHPACAGEWGDDRIIHAEVIIALLLGGCSTVPGSVAMVHLDGARIVGELNLRFAAFDCHLRLANCAVPEPVNLYGARTHKVTLSGSHLAELNASSARIDGHLQLNRCRMDGPLRLEDGDIRGALFLDGAHLMGDPVAIRADRVTIGADLLCRDGFAAEGTVRLHGAHVTGSVNLDGARLRGAPAEGGGGALRAPGLTVGASMLCRDLVAERGEIHLEGAGVTGDLTFTGARLTNPGGRALSAARMAIGRSGSLDNARIDGEVRMNGARVAGPLTFNGASVRGTDEVAVHLGSVTADGLYLRGGFRAEGEIRLSGARVEGPIDFSTARLAGRKLAIGGWWVRARELNLSTGTAIRGRVDLRYARFGLIRHSPGHLPDEVRMDGLSYESFMPPLRAEQRLAWLARDPHGFRPQPYEHLAAMFRRHGDDASARTVLLAKHRRRRTGLRWWAKAWGYLQDATVGYGYRPGRAAALLLALMLAGWAAFTRHPPRPLPDAPDFVAPVYVLDLLLPIIDFGQERAFVATGTGQWLGYGLIAGGWLFATTIAAGISRVLSRQ